MPIVLSQSGQSNGFAQKWSIPQNDSWLLIGDDKALDFGAILFLHHFLVAKILELGIA